MRIVLFMIAVSITQALALDSYAQNTRLSLNFKDEIIVKILNKIEDESEFYFMYDATVVDVNQRRSINCENRTVTKILDEIFKNSGIRYKIDDRQIALSNTNKNLEKSLSESNQQKNVSGKVTDESGQPLPGVTVVIKGNMQGTVTNSDGEYYLSNVPEDATLQFSFVGMKVQEIPVAGKSTINVKMAEETIGIDEVVAIGYGNLSRKRVSTAISMIDNDVIEKRKGSVGSMDGLLEGQLAGVSVKQNTGAPGAGAQIEIRGSGSIGGGGDPLFVINGIPYSSIYSKERSPLAVIDPSNIKSIDVLKGVSASAIYGSRGSNGVILVTTESGKFDAGTQMSFNVSYGLKDMMPSEKMDLMNAEEFAQWRKDDAYEKANFYGYEITDNDIPEVYRNPEFWRGKGADWQDILTRVAPQKSFNFNISHGTENFSSYFSVGYTNDDGIIVATDFKRLSMVANVNYKFKEYIKTGIDINSSLLWWGNKAGGSRSTLWGNTVIAPPIDGPYFDDYPNENPQYFDGIWDLDIYADGVLFHYPNSLYNAKKQVLNDHEQNLIFQPYIEINPLKELVFKSTLNIQSNNSSSEYFKPSTITEWAPPPGIALGEYATGKSFNWQLDNLLTYKKTFGDHFFSGMAGYTLEHYNSYSSRLTGSDYSGDEIKTLNAANTFTGSSGEENWSMVSYFMRLSYSYKDKYLFTGTYRRDGSSRFGPDNRWGSFPSASVGWNISEEDFFPKNNWLTNVKLRSSYGMSGNNKIGNYSWISYLVKNNYNLGEEVASGSTLSGIENLKLGWEKSKEFDLGLELTLFNGRLFFDFDYYDKITTNMLWSVPIPRSSGYTSMLDNIGKISNKGAEFSINSKNISNGNFHWETAFNISFNHNKVLDLGTLEKIESTFDIGAGRSITMEGYPLGMFWGYKSLGIFQNQSEIEQYANITGGQLPGTPRWEDFDGNGEINEKDRQIIGNPHPDFRGGMNNTISYKNWDASMSISFAYNYDIYASLESSTLNLGGIFNVTREVEQRWKSPEDPGNGRIPASFHQTQLDRDNSQSKFVYNVSFLKVQYFTFGYTLDDIRFAKSLRLYCSITNPLLFTNYPYGNPDVNDNGNSSLVRNIDAYDYPLTRGVEFGLNISF